MNKDEQEKIARAMLPRNFEQCIEGRKRVTEIVNELAPRVNSGMVPWPEIQKRYQQKYEVNLAGDV